MEEIRLVGCLGIEEIGFLFESEAQSLGALG